MDNKKNIIVGTAGHIDHGKTTLIRALTGRNTDRLKEEQNRGISIELGFTHFDLTDELRVGIIDVPGHEKFIKNMLSGVCGMDMIILVVAADEGMMAQTKEHLDILNLIGIKNGIIALTKCDLVDKDWIELVKLDIADEVSRTFLEDAKIIEVSSTEKTGIDKLKEEIIRIVDTLPEKDLNTNSRLYVDRSFSITGFGTVVTGTLISGILNLDDEIWVYPSNKLTKVRNLQVHDNNVNTAYSGQRVAVNLANIKKEDVSKGSVLVPNNTFTESSIIDVKLKTINLPFEITNRTRFHLYLGSSEVLCRAILLENEELESNKEYIVQLRLEEPIISKRNDKFILRLFSPLYTVGGGYIIDSNATKKKRFNSYDIEQIKTLDNCNFKEYIYNYIDRFSDKFYFEKNYYNFLSDSDKNISKLIDELIYENKVISFGNTSDRLILSDRFIEKLIKNITKFIKDFHEKYPKRIGISKETIKSKFFDLLNGKTKNEFMNYLIYDKFKVSDEYISTLDFNVLLDDEDFKNVQNIKHTFNSNKFSIVNFEDFSLNMNIEHFKELILYLIGNKEVVKLDSGYMLKDNYDLAVNMIREFIIKNGTISVSDARDLLNSNRKSTMELLEFLDKEKITLRKDNERILVK
ncbi:MULTISPECIES: selenocysteine-specific translation elongation factor [unclassified Parvimonas]|uniref:selenocysteine-specific translation elongation factor n=1 Tax=unclassified Parvimonas TaxID=1151464 RepID=UPI002B4640E4|nr:MULTISPECIES: selenocysteine-specific translation elongation factor [unclassified Parvimonas]MEB3024688.1 selenocysteine-specific translation elongation factor [Parvimonas sp. M13]MEB3088833.1 selenocysteine-specific translation elongation factor [Parvimonas sp. M20]